MVTSPVAESRFIPQRSDHAAFNVQTDVAAIGAFGGLALRVDPQGLLFSDLQTQTGFHEYGRLGSGRTGYYQGAYLKGVGRTPLAANWWRFGDRFHATGHLSASCGAREWIVSRYFVAKGKGHLINPCEGLLVAELEPQLREASAWRRWKNEECLPCDLTLQAISVKAGQFLRFSNLSWYLNHLGVASAEDDLIRFFVLFMRGLRPEAPVELTTLVPSAIARTLRDTVERTIANYREYFRLGINWLMPYNNFTMDGRFCDLDVPLFTGPGYVGVIPSRETWPIGSPTVRAPDHLDFGSIFGLNVIAYLHQVRTVLRCLSATLSGLIRAEFHYSSAEIGFVEGFLEALAEEFPREHVLWSGPACAEMLKTWAEEECEIVSAHRPRIHALIDHAVAMRLDHTTRKGMSFEIAEVPLRCARAGVSPNLTESFYALVGAEPRPERLEEAQFLNDWIARLDQITDLDEFLARSIEAGEAIERHCCA